MIPKKNKSTSAKQPKNFKNIRAEKAQNYMLKALSTVVGTDDSIDIKDCGFVSEAAFFCPKHTKPTGCLKSVSDGAWLPSATISKQLYDKCKKIKQSQNDSNSQFTSAFGNSYL